MADSMSKLKKYEAELVMILPVHTEISRKLVTEAKNKEDAELNLINSVLSNLRDKQYIEVNEYWYSTSAIIRWNLHGLKEVNEEV